MAAQECVLTKHNSPYLRNFYDIVHCRPFIRRRAQSPLELPIVLTAFTYGLHLFFRAGRNMANRCYEEILESGVLKS